MFTLDWWLPVLASALLGGLITAIIQGGFDKKKDQKRLVIQGMLVVVFLLVMYVTYRSIVGEYGPLEWNRLKMVWVQFAAGLSIFLVLMNFGTYIVVSIAAKIGHIKLERGKSVRTWVIIFVCIFILVWAYQAVGYLIAERIRIIDSVTEDLITDALIPEQTSNEIFP